jgi:DNA adenine methylase
MTPFLKWPGGKRWFVAKHSHLIPIEFDRYIEPFLGGGSVFFYLRPKRATIGDTNSDLIAAYQGLRDDCDAVEQALCRHELNHSADYYYGVRDSSPKSAIERAARFIYLNRTCFNGIYRVNLKGKFNVPKGTKSTVIFDQDDFEDASSLLQRAKICIADFEELVDTAKRNDLVFADPPYTVRHNSNAFIKYNEKLFSWDDQVRLADSLMRARNRGARIVVTNANHKAVRLLYADRGFHIRAVARFSSISADPDRREQFQELVALDGDPSNVSKRGGNNGRH